jgi:hypothetical protein
VSTEEDEDVDEEEEEEEEEDDEEEVKNESEEGSVPASASFSQKSREIIRASCTKNERSIECSYATAN